MVIDRKRLFDGVRAPLFKGRFSASQVAGIDAIIDAFEATKFTNLDWAAYMLATAYHEVGGTMQPITERGPRAYFNKYEPGTRIGKALGNTIKGDGYLFRGRGYTQITGRANYAKASAALGVDLVAKPELALSQPIAAKIMTRGMSEGWFTGRELADYFNYTGQDWIGARRIINGTDRAELIAGYARIFRSSLYVSPPTQRQLLAPILGQPDDPGPEEEDGPVAPSVSLLQWLLMKVLGR